MKRLSSVGEADDQEKEGGLTKQWSPWGEKMWVAELGDRRDWTLGLCNFTVTGGIGCM